MAAGSLAGAIVLAGAATLVRGAFHPPAGGVGFVTVHAYPKSFDYFVVAMIVAGSMIGGILAAFLPQPAAGDPRPATRSPRPLVASLVVFIAMLFIHDHPYELMEPFHEGEHLVGGSLLRSGARPYRDVFFLHGLAVDGGLDALVLGDPPSPRHERRLETLLDAAALALLVPIAAEVVATPVGMIAAAIAALCAMGAGEVPVFPYFRLAPLLLATWGLLRHSRTGRTAPLAVALCASTLGVLWSLDTGMYALAGTVVTLIVLRWRPPLWAIALAILLPLAVLLAARADLRQFIVDSFVTIPRAIDAVWSLPARTDVSWESARYYFPPLFYGFLLVLALGKRDKAMAIVAIVSLFAFRTAAGRCSWSHTRYGVPLLGVAIVAFVIEPLFATRRRLAAAIVSVIAIFYVELIPNTVAVAKFIAGWHARQSHAGLVAWPLSTGRGIYTTPGNARDLAALNGFLSAEAPPGSSILDLSNERALYYLLQRPPSVRCPDIAMLSAPPLRDEALGQLARNPPACVIVHATPMLDSFDGVSNRRRAPEVFAWVEANYPRVTEIGRFTVRTK